MIVYLGIEYYEAIKNYVAEEHLISCRFPLDIK